MKQMKKRVVKWTICHGLWYLVVFYRMFGFVARRSSELGNVCHLFAELDSEQPATAIVNFINKVMLGPQQLRKWTQYRRDGEKQNRESKGQDGIAVDIVTFIYRMREVFLIRIHKTDSVCKLCLFLSCSHIV